MNKHGPGGAPDTRSRRGDEPGGGQGRHEHQEVEAAEARADQQRPARQPTGQEPLDVAHGCW